MNTNKGYTMQWQLNKEISTTHTAVPAASSDNSTPSTSTVFVTPSASTDTVTREHRVKLPKLTTPTFDGNLTMWTPFWDLFDSAINQNSVLTNIKFNYLRTLLKGSARDSIAGLTLTATNYTEVVALLNKRYRNSKLLLLATWMHSCIRNQ